MRKIIIALIASTGVLSGCSDFLGTDPDNRTYIDTPEKSPRCWFRPIRVPRSIR